MLLPIGDWMLAAPAWVARNKTVAPLVYLVLVSVATVLFLPGSVAIMISGFLFGLLPGLLIAAIVIPVASQCAFVAGRWAIQDFLRNLIDSRPHFRAIELGLQSEAFLIVVLTRLSLIIPFNMLNYIFGASSIKARVHFGATMIGMLPAVALYVYIGTLAQNFGQLMAGEVALAESRYWIVIAGLVVIALAIWVIQKAANRALEKYVAIDAADQHKRMAGDE
jgi:uncharacterized membrane protein YdjX (TVP38/TMEM64 family)